MIKRHGIHRSIDIVHSFREAFLDKNAIRNTKYYGTKGGFY